MNYVKTDFVSVGSSQVELNYHSQTMGVWSDGSNCGLFKKTSTGWIAFVYSYGWTSEHQSVEDALEEAILNAKTPNQDLYDFDSDLDEHDDFNDYGDSLGDYDNSGNF